ncbi:MAG: lantibiotic dehydratase, partial [Thermosynechococcaceae cyanobacterium]
RLAGTPTAQSALQQLESTIEAASLWDELPPADGEEVYQKLISIANESGKAASKIPVQVDMAMSLGGKHLNRSVGLEAAKAAELLLRLTPFPRGLTYLEAYRRAFESRYQQGREVPILELLDPNFGLGPPLESPQGSGLSPAKAAQRTRTLLSLALNAVRDRKLVVDLNPDTLALLETWTPSDDAAPPSLDMTVSVAATSADAIDAGNFQIVVGPNVGASAAGRHLGRFADLLGSEAQVALEHIARTEERHSSNQIWAELSYLPRHTRSANVVVRPALRSYEILLGVGSGVNPSNVIPLDELVVGVRNNRFYVRWPTRNVHVVVSAGHMLNNMQAPVVCRFLSDISRDGLAQLSAFDWGPATGFPFLPRVQVGRIVLQTAQWCIDTSIRERELPTHSQEIFREALNSYRERWQVPQYVYLSFGDNRLLLNLEDARQVEELQIEVRSLQEGRQIVLQEVLPGLNQIWTQGPGGHFVTEFVVPLALRNRLPQSNWELESPGMKLGQNTSTPENACSPILQAERLKPLGSDWLYIKLYCGHDIEEDLISGPIRLFCEEIVLSGLAEDWFFIRYSDPDPHIRLRFRGESKVLIEKLMPDLCAWATELMTSGLCSKFSFDTYEREIERYGGIPGMQVAERLFATDSKTVARLLNIVRQGSLPFDLTGLAVLSVDTLLEGLGLDEETRLRWYRYHSTTSKEGGEDYRQRKNTLRILLKDPDNLLISPDSQAVIQLLTSRHTAMIAIVQHLQKNTGDKVSEKELFALYGSFAHMHCNRIFGTDRRYELRVIELLLRTRMGLAKSK